MAEDKGYAQIVYTYNEKSKLIERAYYDAEGNLTNNSNGYAKMTQTWNGAYVLTGIYYTDEAGAPVIGPDGYYAMETDYVGYRYATSIRYLDDQKQLMYYAPAGYAEYKASYVFVEAKLYSPTSEAWYDAEGNLIVQKGGYSQVAYTYGFGGKFLIDTMYMNADGELVMNSLLGYAKKSTTYNSKWKALRVDYLDQNEMPIMQKEGYASIMNVYNTTMVKGHTVAIEYYLDENGEMILRPGGFYGIATTFSGKQNNTTRYLDQEGELMDNDIGYARREERYTSFGRIEEIAYYNAEGKLAFNNIEGYAKVTHLYDKGRREKAVITVDANGQLINNEKGYAKVTYERDSNHYVLKTMYYGEDDCPVITSMGYAGILYTRYKDGKAKTTTYLDADGMPIEYEEGYTTIENTYDGGGKVLTESYYDANGKAVMCTAGYHTVTYAYSESGRKVGTAYSDL